MTLQWCREKCRPRNVPPSTHYLWRSIWCVIEKKVGLCFRFLGKGEDERKTFHSRILSSPLLKIAPLFLTQYSEHDAAIYEFSGSDNHQICAVWQEKVDAFYGILFSYHLKSRCSDTSVGQYLDMSHQSTLSPNLQRYIPHCTA